MSLLVLFNQGGAAGPIEGTASVTLGPLTGSGTGVLGSTITGTGSVTLGELTGSGTANLSLAGQGSVTLGSLTGSGTATLIITGTGSVTLGTLTGSGTGTLGNSPIAGVGSATLGVLTGSGTGTLTISGVSNATLGALTGSGTGTLTTVSGPCPTAQEIAQEVWNYILEGSVSAGQMLRGVARTQLAKVDVNEVTGQVTIYKFDGTTIFAQALTSEFGDRTVTSVDWSA